jgi:hypothetical protein
VWIGVALLGLSVVLLATAFLIAEPDLKPGAGESPSYGGGGADLTAVATLIGAIASLIGAVATLLTAMVTLSKLRQAQPQQTPPR